MWKLTYSKEIKDVHGNKMKLFHLYNTLISTNHSGYNIILENNIWYFYAEPTDEKFIAGETWIPILNKLKTPYMREQKLKKILNGTTTL